MLHLETVLKALESAEMSVKLSKCKFAMPKVTYIGHHLGSGSRLPVTDKVVAIKAIPEPHSKKSLRSFLGAVGFYRMYIPHFSDIAIPLTDLLKKDKSNKFKLNDKERNAFLTLKSNLCNCVNLYSIDYCKDFHLFADSSMSAVGVMLAQKRDGDGALYPIAFASGKFTGSQLNWAVIQKEAYAILFGLRKFEHVVYGRRIWVWSDHNPLEFVMKASPTSSMLMRWALSLARFDLQVVHLPGKDNVIADFLSRVNIC